MQTATARPSLVVVMGHESFGEENIVKTELGMWEGRGGDV
jgi:hypothetical protein